MTPNTRPPWMRRAGDYPTTDSEYFELLTRAVMSAGLGPRLIEVRWNGIKAAFCDFDIEVVAHMTPADSDRLMSDPGIIRNRRKIDATIENAKVFLRLIEARGSFHEALDSFIHSAPLTRDRFHRLVEIVSQTFLFLGPTSAEMFLFSCGYRAVDD